MEQDTNGQNPSGAPEAGGATNSHSMFGGTSLVAQLWRFLARAARDLEATAYRRLKEMEQRSPHDGGLRPGAPRRTREAGPRPRVTGPRIHST